MSVRPYDLGWIPGTSQTLNSQSGSYDSTLTEGIENYYRENGIGDYQNSSVDLKGLLSGFADTLTSSFQNLATSSLKAEQAAADKANALTYQMFKESQQYNSDEALKAFERNQSSADKAMDFERSERLASQDYYTQMANTSYQRAVSDLEAAGLNPALALSGLSGASSAMSSGASGSTASSPAGSSSGGSSAKANSSSALNVQANVMSKVLQALVDIYSADLSSSSKLRDSLISGAFGLVGKMF